MKTVVIKNNPIEIYSGPIGLSLSGGADSAILAYILMKYSEGPIHFFTVGVKEKNFITVKHSNDVIKKCRDLTGNNNVFHHVSYVDVNDRKIFFENLVNNVKKMNLEIMYTSTTSVPSNIDLDLFLNKIEDDIIERRNPNKQKNLYSHYKIYHPLLNVNKKEIKALYDELGVLEEIFPLTRSCESVEIFDKHCRKCWWCEERFWAFERYE